MRVEKIAIAPVPAHVCMIYLAEIVWLFKKIILVLYKFLLGKAWLLYIIFYRTTVLTLKL